MLWRSRPLEAAQHALPLVFLTLGVLELGGIIYSLVAADPMGIAAAGGPTAFVPVTLAVVFATLLRPSRRSVTVKGATAVGALVFFLVRIGLVAGIVLTDTDAVSLGAVLGVVSGIVLGLTLAAWAAMEFVAARLQVRQGPAPASRPSPAEAALPPSPASPPVRPVEADPGTVRTHLSGRLPRPVNPAVPAAPHPVSAATPAAGPPERRATGAVAWHRGSTPWPRKNEDDPDGTLLRPPRRR
ncbi:hypothetical protein GCM10028820_25620 [Tessaracoccus terricola]